MMPTVLTFACEEGALATVCASATGTAANRATAATRAWTHLEADVDGAVRERSGAASHSASGRRAGRHDDPKPVKARARVSRLRMDVLPQWRNGVIKKGTPVE